MLGVRPRPDSGRGDPKGQVFVTMLGRQARRFSIALVVAALALVSAAPASLANDPGDAPDTGRSVIEVGGTAVVRPGSIVDHVYAIGADTVVAGVVLHDVVCIGGDVVLLPSAIVQENVVCIGGSVDRDAGAVVLGDTTVVSGGALRSLAGWNPIEPMIDPFSGSALLGWALSALVYIGLAAAVAAAAPRPVATTMSQAREHPWSRFGLGLVSALVVVPAVSVALFVSAIGVPLLVPWLLVIVPVALVVSFVSVSVLIGEQVLRLARRPARGIVVNGAIGAGILSLARLIPYAGTAAWLVAWTLGFGAVSVSLVHWLRERRFRKRSPADATKTPT